MRQSSGSILTIAVVVASACGGNEAGRVSTTNWSLDPGIRDIGDGIPFCESAMARVADFMGQFEGQPPPDERYGGTAVAAAKGPLSGGMNGHVSAQQETTDHQNFVSQMTLLQYDADLNAVPYLAESWDVADDNTSVTFRIRDDVYWHDGELTDAHDVVYTFRRAVDGESGFPNAPWFDYYDQRPDGVEVVDSFTVTFKIQPHAGFLDAWRQLTIMPQHLLEDVPAAELAQHPYGTVCPVGNGPFIFTEHRQGASWTFQANPAFPEGLGGRPFLDRYIFRTIVDPTTLLTELLTENVDFYSVPTPDQLEAIEASDAVEVRAFPYRQVEFVAWNSRRTQLADKRVRQAITKAVNRPEMVASIYQGFARPVNSTVPPYHWAYDESIGLEAMAYDQGAARALLDEAGWMDRDGDGVRENAEGVELSLELKFNPDPQRQAVAEIMQSQLAEVGIEARPVSVDFGALLNQVTDPSLRDFNGWIVGFGMDFAQNDAALFHSDNGDDLYGFAGTQRPDIDAYLDRIPLIVDREEAKVAWREYQELLVDEQPFTFTYVADRLDGVNKRLQGVVTDVRGEWQSTRHWWIPADQRRGAGR